MCPTSSQPRGSRPPPALLLPLLPAARHEADHVLGTRAPGEGRERGGLEAGGVGEGECGSSSTSSGKENITHTAVMILLAMSCYTHIGELQDAVAIGYVA